MTATTLAPTDLGDLAALINESHATVLEGQRTVLASASIYLSAKRQVGEYLLEANNQLPHGQWLPWLQESCPNISKSTAYNYMSVAKNWDDLAESTSELRNVNKLPTFGNLGIVKALELIRKTDEVVEAELVEEEESEDELDVVPDRTPPNIENSPPTESIQSAKSEYLPQVGDIARIKSNGPHEFVGQFVEVTNVYDKVVAVFKTVEAHIVSSAMNTFMELVERKEPGNITLNALPEGVEKDKAVSADASLPVGVLPRQHAREDSPAEHAPLGTSTPSHTPRTNFLEEVLAWVKRVTEAVDMPKDLLDEGLRLLSKSQS